MPAWPPAWAGGFGDRLSLLCLAAGIVALLWALTGRRSLRVNLMLTVLLFIAAGLLAAEAAATLSAPLPEAVTVPEDTP